MRLSIYNLQFALRFVYLLIEYINFSQKAPRTQAHKCWTSDVVWLPIKLPRRGVGEEERHQTSEPPPKSSPPDKSTTPPPSPPPDNKSTTPPRPATTSTHHPLYRQYPSTSHATVVRGFAGARPNSALFTTARTSHRHSRRLSATAAESSRRGCVGPRSRPLLPSCLPAADASCVQATEG